MTTVSSPASRPHGGGAHRKASSQGFIQRTLIPAAIMLLGVCILLYPVVATQWNNWLQAKVASTYEQEVQGFLDDSPTDVAAIIEAARAYNAEHTNGPILDPWLARISEDNADYQLYLQHLSGLSAMSSVAIPSINSNLPVYHGTSVETLQTGIGHLYGSALPVGGEGNHTVLTGHTGMPNATLWDNLIDVEVGDAIYLSTFGERLKYEVHDIEVVLPHETDSLASVPGEDLLTLITCTPYGINTHRILVHAHRVEIDAADAEVFGKTGFTMQWWMWVVLVLAILILIAIIRWIMSERKKAQANEEA